MIWLSFVQNINQMFPFSPWCWVLHITLHWHPSIYSNSCDFDRIFASVNGCKKTFLSQLLVGLETSIKTSAVTRLLIPADIPSRYCVTVCFVSLSAALLFSIRSINGRLFQRSRWPYAQHPLEENILLWLHKQQVIRFLGGRMNAIILGTHCACSIAILVI